MKIRKDDEVKVIRGKDKGKTGKVEKVLSRKNTVVVAGINQYKRHMKTRSVAQKSEIVTVTKPMSLANVQLICPKCHLPTRVGYAVEDGVKKRVCRKCNQAI